MSDPRDSLRHQVMWTRLVSIVEEQAQALIRTAFSTSVREAGDLSAGVYDRAGHMLAQAVTGTPGHVNAMAEAVGHFIDAIGRQTFAEGDVYLTNDPWMGTGHLHDITVVTPVFREGAPGDGHVGFLACTAHVVDIGGRGFGADGESLYEEGLQIPIMRLHDGAKGGEVDRTLLALIRANTREPDQLVGDLFALAACNDVGRRRLLAMMAEYGLADIEGLSGFILAASREATVAAIARLPRARASNRMTTDGYATPITLAVTVETHDDHVSCDFAGTSPPDPKGINVPLVYARAYAAYALKIAIAPEVPNNAGSLAPFVVTAPEGTIVNARRPAPVSLRHVIGHLIPDTVFGAFDRIVPGLVPAEGAGALCNFQVSLWDGAGGRSEVLTFNSGGTGARPALDGLSATAFPSGVMTMPVEATEHAGPVVIHRKELRPDSGGPGRTRGGLGQVMEVGPREGWRMEFRAQFDRMRFPPRGREGGGPGAPTEVALSDGTAFPAKARFRVPEGQNVRLGFPGGGGLGPPSTRDPEAIARDVRLGYVSEGAAARDYGWAP